MEPDQGELELKPQPSRYCFHESSHAVAAAYYRRPVYEVFVSRYGAPECRHESASERIPEGEAIRQDLTITLAGHMGEVFYRPELDRKLEEQFGVIPHAEQMRLSTPMSWELDVLAMAQAEDELDSDELPLNDTRKQIMLLDRLAVLEPGLDREYELTEAEGRAAKILAEHEDIVRDIAGLLRDDGLIQAGVCNAIFQTFNPGD